MTILKLEELAAGTTTTVSKWTNVDEYMYVGDALRVVSVEGDSVTLERPKSFGDPHVVLGFSEVEFSAVGPGFIGLAGESFT